MMRAGVGASAFVALVVASMACGSSSSGTSAGSCTPGQSVSCVGAGGCAGGQVCNSAGTAFGDCNCGASGGDGGSAGDSGSSGDASAPDSGTFTPASLLNLVLWAEASDGTPDAGLNLVLPDHSGLRQSFGVTNGAPVYVASSTIASGPAIRFAFGADQMRASLGRFTSDDYVALVVVNINSAQNSVFGIAGDNAGGGFEANGGGGTAEFLNAQVTAPCANGTTHVLGVRSSNGYVRLRVDGASTGSVAQTTTPGQNAFIYLGYTGMDVAEVIIAITPSDADVANLEGYLKSKYGL